MNPKYTYIALKGFVEINTQSPNGNFYYKITKPYDRYWGCFVCKIAFYKTDGTLIYHNPEFQANFLNKPNSEKLEFVNWSECGDFAFINERAVNDLNEFYFVLLDLKRKRKYKLKDYEDNYRTLIKKYFPKLFNTQEIQNIYLKLLTQRPKLTNELKKDIENNLSANKKEVFFKELDDLISNDFERAIEKLSMEAFSNEFALNLFKVDYNETKTEKLEENWILKLFGKSKWNPNI